MNPAIESTFLFAIPSWKEGVGMIFDIGGTFVQYNNVSSGDGNEADALAIQMDWSAVGASIRVAIEEVEDGLLAS